MRRNMRCKRKERNAPPCEVCVKAVEVHDVPLRNAHAKAKHLQRQARPDATGVRVGTEKERERERKRRGRKKEETGRKKTHAHICTRMHAHKHTKACTCVQTLFEGAASCDVLPAMSRNSSLLCFTTDENPSWKKKKQGNSDTASDHLMSGNIKQHLAA